MGAYHLILREGLLLILLQDLLGKTVQLDGQAVIGFHRGDVHHTILDVGPLEAPQKIEPSAKVKAGGSFFLPELL